MATETEIKFFKSMNIKPIMLCQCSFKNLKDYRLEIGDDNCEHLEDYEFSCKDCEKSYQITPLYPLITSDIILRLIDVLTEVGSLKISQDWKTSVVCYEYNNNYWTSSSKYFKECILDICTNLDCIDISQQVQSLFED